jgi:hypothetical protein
MDFEYDVSEIEPNRHQTVYGLVDPTFCKWESKLERAHRLIFEESLPIRLRYIDYEQNTKELGNEPIIVRILVQGAPTLINEVKIELRSDQDLFFNLDATYYRCYEA